MMKKQCILALWSAILMCIHVHGAQQAPLENIQEYIEKINRGERIETFPLKWRMNAEVLLAALAKGTHHNVLGEQWYDNVAICLKIPHAMHFIGVRARKRYDNIQLKAQLVIQNIAKWREKNGVSSLQSLSENVETIRQRKQNFLLSNLRKSPVPVTPGSRKMIASFLFNMEPNNLRFEFGFPPGSCITYETPTPGGWLEHFDTDSGEFYYTNINHSPTQVKYYPPDEIYRRQRDNRRYNSAQVTAIHVLRAKADEIIAKAEADGLISRADGLTAQADESMAQLQQVAQETSGLEAKNSSIVARLASSLYKKLFQRKKRSDA